MQGNSTETYYTRTADGNTLGLYEGSGGMPPTITERYLYGTDRVGKMLGQNWLNGPIMDLPTYNDRRIELKDHLGNVRTLLDGSFGGGVTDIHNYYAFGGVQPELSLNPANMRYGFNGMEQDIDLGGIGSTYDFGARMYDAELGRFFSLDPQAATLPTWSPYSFSFNNPILFIDPDGERPIPVSSAGFRSFAQAQGIFGNQQIGSYFERMAIACIQTTKSVYYNTTTNYPSPVRTKMNNGMPASVRPDGIGSYIGTRSDGAIFYSPSFYEAKATKATITPKYRKGQITDMIDAVANMDLRRDERASFTLITTSDTKISRSIIEYATKRNVMLFVSVAAIDDETGEFILSEKQLLNGNVYDAIIDQARKLNGAFDEFKGVNPDDYVDGSMPADKSDPDPATIEDKVIDVKSDDTN